MALLNAVEEYKGAVYWWMHDDCISPLAKKPEFIGLRRIPNPGLSEKELQEHNDALRRPPDPAFVQEAVADIPIFCAYLEKRLELTERPPQEFDAAWLTVVGLAQSKGEFEDFVDPGIWSVFLARDPNRYAKTFKPTSDVDRSLSMGLSSGQRDELFKELGADWSTGDSSSGKASPLIAAFPLLSRFDDETNDVLFEVDEVSPFLAELLRAQQKVKAPRSIRGLDNLIRIARWAESLKVGIHFGGV